MCVAAEPSQHTKPSTLTRFVLNSLVSTHTNTDTLAKALAHTHTHTDVVVQYTRITQTAHSDHAGNPKGKWHNRDTKASHLHLRRTAPYRLRWGSTLVLLRGNVGRIFTSGPVNHLTWRLGSLLHSDHWKRQEENKHGSGDNNPVLLYPEFLLFISRVSPHCCGTF